MKTRILNTIASVVALAVFSLAAQAEAGDPLERLIGKIGKHVDLTYPMPRPTPLPYPLPYPRPCPSPMPLPYPLPYPQPAPQPVPLPSPAPAYFLGVYTSTVPVGMPVSAPADGGPQAFVVPGYGEQAYGQRINSIVPNSPAFHAGLEPGDILVNANGIALDSDELLRAAIAESEGYMEMQVLDSRSGQLVWVVAETDPQNSVPMVVSNSNLNAARKAFKVKSSQRTQSAKSVAPGRSMQRSVKSLPRSVPQAGNDGRRPPVRRR